MKYKFALITLGLLLFLPTAVNAQVQSTPPYIAPGADISTPPSCSDTQIQSVADNFLINKVGQNYFNMHFSIREFGGVELYAVISYNVSYTLPSGTYTVGTLIAIGDDCQTIVQASGILHPYNVVIDQNTAVNTVIKVGYTPDPSTVRFTAVTDTNPPDNQYGYRKPAWFMHASNQNPACEHQPSYESYIVYADTGSLDVSPGCIVPESAGTQPLEGEGATLGEEEPAPSFIQNYWWIILITVILIIAILVAITYSLKRRT